MSAPAEPAAPGPEAKGELGPLGRSEESFPGRLFSGLDFLEPHIPLVAASRLDLGRLAWNTAVPYAALGAAFAFQGTDKSTLREVKRWDWVGVDEKQNNYVLLYGIGILSGASLFLPAPAEDQADGGYSWALRLDRGLVLVGGWALTELEVALLKPFFHRARPQGSSFAGRPSGHAATAAAFASFFADVLRDTFRPQDEPTLSIRIAKEILCALPYLGGAYIGLERIHKERHFLTDVLLGWSLGALTMHTLYSWAFTREEQGRGWLDVGFVIVSGPGGGYGFGIEKKF